MVKKVLHVLKWKMYSLKSVFIKYSKIKIKNGLVLRLGTKNSHEIHRAKTFYSKEPEMIEWLNNLAIIHKGDDFVFYDIGANIGIYSLYPALLYGSAIIYAFEPESTNFASLCTNIASNKITNIIPFQIAFTETEKFDLLNVGIVSSGAGAASIEGEYYGMPNKLLQGVYCTSLNNIYNNDFFRKPNFIKIDVDGHESTILNNATKILSDKNLKGLMIEFGYSNPKEMNAFITKVCDYGFKLILKSDWVDENLEDNSKVRNFIFERNK